MTGWLETGRQTPDAACPASALDGMLVGFGVYDWPLDPCGCACTSAFLCWCALTAVLTYVGEPPVATAACAVVDMLVNIIAHPFLLTFLKRLRLLVGMQQQTSVAVAVAAWARVCIWAW